MSASDMDLHLYYIVVNCYYYGHTLVPAIGEIEDTYRNVDKQLHGTRHKRVLTQRSDHLQCVHGGDHLFTMLRQRDFDIIYILRWEDIVVDGRVKICLVPVCVGKSQQQMKQS